MDQARTTTPLPPQATRTEPATPDQRRRSGVSSGVNIAPGCDDDGWRVPHPVKLGDGTIVQFYKDGEAMRAAFEAIAAARYRICMEVYIFRSDDTGRAIAELLAKKARDGVRVYVMYDSYGSFESDSEMFRMMSRAGVRLAEFHPVRPWDVRFSWRPVIRDHRKLLVIDDHIGGLGGLNVGGEYAGSWVVRSPRSDEPWRDNAIGIQGPAARLLMQSFARTWHYVHHGGRIRTAELMHDVLHGEFGLLASVPTRSSPLVPLLTRLVREARLSILLTMAYFAPPDELVEELCRAARRGVTVRLMLPGKSDVPILIIAARAFYDKMLAAGVEIYERQHAILHAKTMCIDRNTSIIGSANLDYRTFEMNLELSAFVRCAGLAEQLHELFENDVSYARRIIPSQWRNRPRPLWDRMVQWAVDRARHLL